MNQHLQQAEHNRKFLECIIREFPDDYFDWKLTVMYYEALHLVKALASILGIDIGETHTDIIKNTDPNGKFSKMKFKSEIWKAYRALHKYADTARYQGIQDLPTFLKLKERDFKDATIKINYIRKYISERMSKATTKK